VALAAFLGAAGELSVSTIFLRDVDTVALLSRRLASRYDFSGALWVTSFLVLVTAVAFLLQRKRRTA
jgi:ABC-type Fe3+ transport system permease subunit